MPATTSSAIIPIPPGNVSNLLIGPNLVISKNLNNKNDNVSDISISILLFEYGNAKIEIN